MYYCDLGDARVVGSSPEALVKLNGGRAQLRPIAGTRPRGADAARGRSARAELLADPKENAEHVMLVDLARNDLGRVADAGIVRVEPLSLDRALQPRDAHRQRRQRRARRRAATPSTCSPPPFPPARWSARRRCARWRSSTSSSRCARGFYGGTVGYFGHGGDMDQAITIRTLVFHGDALQLPGGRRHRRRQRAGGGVPRGAREERGAAARARARAGGAVR